MKYVKSINELKEARQAPAKRLFKDVVKGNTTSIEGQKISKEMAQAALDWLTDLSMLENMLTKFRRLVWEL